MASQFIGDARKNSFEIHYPNKMKNSLKSVPCWNNEMSQLRVEVKRQFILVRNTSKVGNWKGFRKG